MRPARRRIGRPLLRAIPGTGVALTVLLLADPVPAGSFQAWVGDRSAPRVDERTHELLDRSCVSDLGRRRVTLFGNGTVRVKVAHRSTEGPTEERMYLTELGPGELEAFRARLAEIDLSEAESSRGGAVGDWVEQCELKIESAAGELQVFRYGRFDSLSLAVSRVVSIAGELDELARDRDPGTGFPPRYTPRPGDVVERADGERFEVIRPTADGGGFELHGVDQPLVLYVPADSFRTEFESLVERRD